MNIYRIFVHLLRGTLNYYYLLPVDMYTIKVKDMYDDSFDEPFSMLMNISSFPKQISSAFFSSTIPFSYHLWLAFKSLFPTVVNFNPRGHPRVYFPVALRQFHLVSRRRHNSFIMFGNPEFAIHSPCMIFLVFGQATVTESSAFDLVAI